MPRRLLFVLCLALILAFSLSLFVTAAESYHTVIVQDESGKAIVTYSGLSANDTVPRPSEELKVGQVFFGWLYSTDGGATFSSDIWDFSDPIGGDLILRASYRDAFSGGSGVYYDPYLLSTAADLHLLSELYRNHTELSRKTMYFRMENDIVLNADLLTNGVPRTDAIPFEPIGTAEKPFRGRFDANGHAIYGLYINKPTTDCVGLFASLSSETIGIAGVSILDSYVCGQNNVGLLAGKLQNAPTPSNGTLAGVVYATGDNAGGLCGLIENASVSLYNGTVTVSGRDNVGGIAGLSGIGTYLDRCAISGRISGRAYVGGIAGYTVGTMILDSSCDADIFASADFAGGATGIVTALPYDPTAPVLSDFTFGGTVSAQSFASPFIGLCTPAAALTEDLILNTQVSASAPAFWFADSLHVYAVSISPDGIPYCRNSLLSFVLTVRKEEAVYRFATAELIATDDTDTVSFAQSHVQYVTHNALTLTFPCGAEAFSLCFTFTSVGEEVLVSASTPHMPNGYTATLAFGTHYALQEDASAFLSELNGTHASGAYAATEDAVISGSFLAIRTGVAGSLSLCGTQLASAPATFAVSGAASGTVGIYGHTVLGETPVHALFSYRTKTAGTPVLLPVMQSTAVAGSTEQQVTLGGGFYLLPNGAVGKPQLTLPEHMRLALPAELTDECVFLPLAVLLAPGQVADSLQVCSVTISIGGASVTASLPVLTFAGTSDLATPAPKIEQNTFLSLSATEIYGFAPNGALMVWEVTDGLAICQTFPTHGTYWCIVPTASGYYSVAELPLHVVTYTTPYITAPAKCIVDVRTPASLTAPQVFPIAGYTFLGWYAEGATTPFDFTTPITASLTIAGKWELHKATVTTQPQAQSKVFSPTVPATLSFVFDHVRAPELTFSFAWYYAPSASDAFTLLVGQTNASLDRFHVLESGLYYAEITATDGITTSITRTETVSLTITPQTVGRPTVTMPAGFPYTGYPLAVTFTDPYAYRAVSGGIQTNLGIYTATVELSSISDYRWADDITAPVTVEWSIIKRKVALPAILGSYTYNGQAQTPTVTTHPDYTATTVTETLAGSYPVTFSLVDPVHCVWENGASTPQVIHFVINLRSPMLTIYNCTKYFDGDPASVYAVTDSSAKIKLLYYDKDGEPLLFPPTTPGTYSVTARVAAVPGKYAAATVTRTVKIEHAIYTVLWSNTTVTYNGEVQLPAFRLLLGGVEVTEFPAYKLVCTEGDSMLPGSYSYKLVWERPTLFHGLANNTCTLTIHPKQLSLNDFPTEITVLETDTTLVSALSDYLPQGVTAHIAPAPTTPGSHRVLVSFTTPAGCAPISPRELIVHVLPCTHTSTDGNAWLSASKGFAEENTPTLWVDHTEGITLPDHDYAAVYVVRGADSTLSLSFAGSARMQVYLVETDGTLNLCTTVYDEAAECATLSAVDGRYLVIDHDPVSPTLIVLLLGAGTAGVVSALVYGIPYLRKRRTAK